MKPSNLTTKRRSEKRKNFLRKWNATVVFFKPQLPNCTLTWLMKLLKARRLIQQTQNMPHGHCMVLEKMEFHWGYKNHRDNYCDLQTLTCFFHFSTTQDNSKSLQTKAFHCSWNILILVWMPLSFISEHEASTTDSNKMVLCVLNTYK